MRTRIDASKLELTQKTIVNIRRVSKTVKERKKRVLRYSRSWRWRRPRRYWLGKAQEIPEADQETEDVRRN